MEAFFTKSFKTKYTTEKSEIRRFQGAFQGLDSSIGKWFGVREHYGKAIFFENSDFWLKNRFFWELFFRKVLERSSLLFLKIFFTQVGYGHHIWIDCQFYMGATTHFIFSQSEIMVKPPMASFKKIQILRFFEYFNMSAKNCVFSVWTCALKIQNKIPCGQKLISFTIFSDIS